MPASNDYVDPTANNEYIAHFFFDWMIWLLCYILCGCACNFLTTSLYDFF